MANVTATPEKKEIRIALVNAAVSALESQGWTVKKVKGTGRGRVRRITRGNESRLAVIRTTQDTWIAFPRNADDTEWVTLSEIDLVVASSVDDPSNPRFALVHLIEGDDMRDRFNRAYIARRAAGHTIPKGRGVWLSLYNEDGTSPVQRVGAGAGLKNPAIARIPLEQSNNAASEATDEAIRGTVPLTIAEAKARLAKTFGVSPSDVKITIEG